jgi:hypothetical protein
VREEERGRGRLSGGVGFYRVWGDEISGERQAGDSRRVSRGSSAPEKQRFTFAKSGEL